MRTTACLISSWTVRKVFVRYSWTVRKHSTTTTNTDTHLHDKLRNNACYKFVQVSARLYSCHWLYSYDSSADRYTARLENIVYDSVCVNVYGKRAWTYSFYFQLFNVYDKSYPRPYTGTWKQAFIWEMSSICSHTGFCK